MTTISPAEAHKQAKDGSLHLIDVRTAVEYRAVHAEGAQPHELSTLSAESIKELGLASNGCVAILCKSGMRATKAAAVFSEAGCSDVRVIEGGTDAWVAAGLPVERTEGTISLERQVRIVAGAMVFVGTLLGAYLNPWWLILPGFVGAGLAFAGITNTCGMAMLLAKMPWNR